MRLLPKGVGPRMGVMTTVFLHRRLALSFAVFFILGLASFCPAQVCNIKVITGANPDYSDIGSMLYSMTSNWKTDAEKCWAIW